MSFEASLKVGNGAYTYYPVSEIEGAAQLPYSLTVLLENALRCGRTPEEAQAMAERIVTAGLAGQTGEEVEFSPARVLFQDFTGVPVFVDFAVMREACADLGGDPKNRNAHHSLRREPLLVHHPHYQCHYHGINKQQCRSDAHIHVVVTFEQSERRHGHQQPQHYERRKLRTPHGKVTPAYLYHQSDNRNGKKIPEKQYRIRINPGLIQR